MAERAEYYYFLKELFPGAGPELLRLLQGAADNAYLLRSDFYTIRDWIEIAGYAEADTLHAILLLMLAALEEGSLCLEVSEPALLRRLRDFVAEPEALLWAARIQESLASEAFPALIGTSTEDQKPVIAHRAGSQLFLYFQKYLRAELAFHHDLIQRVQERATAVAPPWGAVIQEAAAQQPMKLDRDQRLALGSALLSNFTIISGGPGTGKTTIVLTLLRCLVRGGVAPERIALAAPTGRAAQRLTDSLRAGLDRLTTAADLASPDTALREVAATTLHQLLGYRPTRNVFSRHRENPIPADVVIVDEVSMVGLVMMSQLLQALEPKTKLVLLGDKDQLPSVDAGAVLANLVGDERQIGFDTEYAARLAALFPDLDIPRRDTPDALGGCTVLLQTNHRSQEQIRTAAQAIKSQDATLAERLPLVANLSNAWPELEAKGGCWLLEQAHATANELRSFLQQWAEQVYYHARPDEPALASMIDAIKLTDGTDDPAQEARFTQLFTLLDRYRLLTLVREGAWGCDEINRYLDLLLRPRLDGGARTGLFAGAPVLITRNDAARGLYNGDVGITLRHEGGGLAVLFQRHGSFLAIPAEALPAHDLGFALTIHKSQGSEYANVMVVLPPTGGKRLLTKELIYTAITRAKSLAILCSSKEVLKFAISRKIVRESGISASG
jgi:exodeoxyribonuclease V alpha subunit